MKPSSLNPQNIKIYYKVLFGLLIFSLFLPLRHVFDLPGNFATGAYSDFTSFSIYSCDFVILAILVFGTFFDSFKLKPNKVLLILIIWLLFAFLLNIKRETALNYYFFARIGEFIVLHETIRQKGFNYKGFLIKIFVILGSFESFLALWQFFEQRSLGLYLFGEQHLNIQTLGIAKIGLDNLKIIRAYGTFPHSNLLSAFLLTAVFFNLYLFIQQTQKSYRVLLSANLGLMILGLFLSFSRAGLFAMAIGLAVFFILALLMTSARKKVILSVLIVILYIVSSVILLKPYLLARTQILSDQSAKERIFYTQVGLKIIKAHPFAGVGIGTSVLHMEQYSPVQLQPWEIQPIHNYFLLAAAEFGIVGALILLSLFLLYIKELFVKITTNFSFYHLTLLSILCSYLALMMFDHYFYTIEQTQLLLWFILGLIAAEIFPSIKKTPQ